MSLNGPDVSAYQDGINTSAGGIPADFIIAKATEGNDWVSKSCDPQIQGALDAGRGAAAYHFANANQNSADAEAAYFLAQTKGYRGKAIPILDFEGASLGVGASWARRFLDIVYGEWGARPWIYLQYSAAIDPQYDTVVEGNYALWRAGNNGWSGGYSSFEPLDKGRWPFVIADQYTSNGHLPGWGGALDLNVFYGDRSTWDAYVATGDHPVPTPQPPAPSGNVPAYPLPDGYYIGPEAGPAYQISGWHGHGDGVRAFQQRLKDRGWEIGVDGYYGHQGDTDWSQSETGRIIHAYQVEKNLNPDGLGGRQTWNSLWKDPIT